MKDKKTGLTTRELDFASLILSGLSDLDAYRQSNYSQTCSEQTKRVTANKILKRPRVSAYIEQKRSKNAVKSDVTIAEVIDNARYLVDFGRKTGKISAISAGNEQLGKIGGFYSERLDINDIQKQRILDAIEGQEAKRLAELRLKQLVASPQVVENKEVTAQ